MAQIGIAGFFDSVVIDVDDVIEHPHRRGDGVFELAVVECFDPVFVGHQMRDHVDRAEVTDRDFALVSIECDLGTQVG